MGAMKIPFLVIVAVSILLSACGQLETSDFSDNPVAVKMMVSSDGFYRISKHLLQQISLHMEDFDVRSVRLSSAGDSVDYWVEDDQLIFYGQGPPNRYSRFRAYLLEVGKFGIEIGEHSVKPNDDNPVRELSQVKHIEENHIYDG